MKDNYNAFLHPELEPIVGGEGPLKDVKVAIKDNISVENWPLTAGSKILESYVAPYDATVIKKLKAAGATLVGKTNLDEFAMGSSTENSAFGATKNPWDVTRVPGGSSGGSAAAVAADLCDVSLGSDTGGSIRQPAAFCGVTGLKPTYGAVSRYGLVALASSLDVIGPLARSAEDVEKVFGVISGRDDNDQTTIDYNYEPLSELDFSSLKIGYIGGGQEWRGFFDKSVDQVTENFISWFRGKKSLVIPDDETDTLKFQQNPLRAYYIILPAEASANLARFDGIRYRDSVRDDGKLLETYLDTRAKFGSEVKRRILLGTFVLSVGHYDDYYQSAIKAQRQLKVEFRKALSNVDLLVSPTTRTPAFKIGEKTDDPLEMYKEDTMTVAANLAGLPSISIPAGFSHEGLPIGVQLTAAWGKENLLLAIAKAYQKETDWHTRKPEGIDG